ncbi:DUF6286 domain-containing protein [Streptomyces sp. NPDC058052]|uniref:DUF6286 domain-containing protein n=1 Tax=Streptomyces sp. NPDC058052 TaxID=3346316 RepID=UPI0036EEC702
MTDRAAGRIARQAAAEATAPLGGRVLGGSASRVGRSVEVTVEVDLPLSAPVDVGRMVRVRSHVVDRTRHLTGESVAPAHIRIRALGIDRPHPPTPPRPMEPAPAGVGRPWSRRRLATACLALASTVLCGLLVWTALSSYVPGTAAPVWPRVESLVRGAGSSAVVRHGAVPVAAWAGGWLVLLAVTPGDRRALALGGASPARARTTRKNAARLVRGSLVDVPGLRVRSVRFTPRRVTVRGVSAFGSPEDVRSTALGAVAAAVASLPLRRTPAVRLVLREARSRRGGNADG